MENQQLVKPIIVSYSEIFKWQTCQRQYYYRYVLDLTPLEGSAPMDTGNKGHKLLEYFYNYLAEGKSKEEALKLTTIKAADLMKDDGLPDFNLVKAWTLVTNYIRATDFTATSIFVENRFLIPASRFSDDPSLDNVQIGFTPDLVLQRSGNYIDIEDYKFIQRNWSKKKKNRFPQTKLYHVFLEEMNYEVSRTLLRFFNVNTGEMSIQPYTMNLFEKETLIEDFMEGVKEVVRYKTKPEHTLKFAPRTMNYTACQYCDYEFPCSLEAEGKDATKTFKAEYGSGTYDYSR